jgi:hypothetical protein
VRYTSRKPNEVAVARGSSGSSESTSFKDTALAFDVESDVIA